MTEQEQGTSAAAPDPVVEAARVRLAEWLTAQAPSPELGATPEDLAEWEARPAEEYLLFIPPGYANQVFLVADHGISSFAPSAQTLDEAMAAARPPCDRGLN
jgi:hypothetical protein